MLISYCNSIYIVHKKCNWNSYIVLFYLQCYNEASFIGDQLKPMGCVFRQAHHEGSIMWICYDLFETWCSHLTVQNSLRSSISFTNRNKVTLASKKNSKAAALYKTKPMSYGLVYFTRKSPVNSVSLDIPKILKIFKSFCFFV